MKSKILVLIVFLIVLLTCSFWIIALKNIVKSSKTYLEAEKYSVNYLNSNIEQLTKTAKNVIKDKPEKGYNHNSFKEIYYISYGGSSIDVNGNYASFHFKDDGFVHDVNWGLIYSPSNTYEGEEQIYIDRDSGHNNIFIRKKIRDNWFFYYDDFDGTTDLNDVKKNYTNIKGGGK